MRVSGLRKMNVFCTTLVHLMLVVEKTNVLEHGIYLMHCGSITIPLLDSLPEAVSCLVYYLRHKCFVLDSIGQIYAGKKGDVCGG